MSATVSPAPVVHPPALEPERPVEWPRRTVRTLSNGLQVVLAESHAFPRMSVQLFIRSGNAAVTLESPGLADITASVVRTGTASRDEHRIEQDLRRMGAELGTSAGADSSAISVAGLAEFSTPILELIVDLAQHATLPVAQFERERRQALEELKIERTTPGFLAGERMRRVLFGAHPYAVVAPTEEQVNAYRREDLERFYRRHYVPTDSLLIAVGDFASGRLMDEIERIFNSWKAPEPPASEWPAPPEIHGRRVHLVHLPGTVQTEVLIGNRAITRRDPDWMRLTLANSIYGGAFNSRLVRNIREEKGYTYSPRSTAHALRHGGYFTVHAAVRNDVVAASLTEMFYEIDKMRSVSVGEDELADARNYMSGVFSLGVATQSGLLGQFAVLYLERLAEDYLEKYRERIRAMTAGDVLAAARKYFDSANAQIAVVGDREQVAAQAALFGDVDYYDAQGNRL